MGKLFAVVGLCLAAMATSVQAQEGDTRVPNPNTEIERLRKVVLEEQQVIAECMKRIDKLEAGKATMDKNGLADLKVSGDFRYRYEYIEEDPQRLQASALHPFWAPKEEDSRDRHRIRLRVGADWKANEEWTVGAQLATTMDSDPVSTNQTLTGSFSKKDIWLNLAYFDYHPKQVPGLKLIGGKMKNPFYTPGGTQLIWDADLTPEGLALTYTTGEKFPAWEAAVNAGYFQVEERSIEEESDLFGLQGVVKYNLMEEGKANIRAGLSYYDYGNAENFPPFVSATNNFGNSLSLAVMNGLTQAGFYADDFNLVEAFAEVTFPVGKIPFTVFADYVVNTAANDNYFDTGDGDTGWAAGLLVNRCVAPGSWAVRYEYRDLGRDAVVGAFTDSDFGGGGTNCRGHILGAEYMMFKNVKLAATYFNNENEGSDLLRLIPTFGSRENPDGNYQRLQLDVNVKF